MSRFGARTRPSEAVSQWVGAPVNLGTLWMTGNLNVLVDPEIPPGITFGGNILTFTRQLDEGDWDQLEVGFDWAAGIRGGRLFTWGLGSVYRTGLGSTANVKVPTEPLPSTGWTHVNCGRFHGFAIRDGELYSWGSNTNGRTAQGINTGQTQTPTQVGTLDTFVDVSSTEAHGLALLSSGEILSWGNNGSFRNGQGIGTGNTLTPTQIGTDTDFAQVAAGTLASAVIKTDGTLFTCGANSFTAQGTTSGNTETLTQVGTDTDFEFVSMASGHAMAIKGGAVFTWGQNNFGRTGRNTNFGTVLTPTAVVLTNVVGDPVSVGAYREHSILVTDQGVFSTGRNQFGRTGAGTEVGERQRFQPVLFVPEGQSGWDRTHRGSGDVHNAILKKKKP